MHAETLTSRPELVIRRQRLGPGEAGRWHTDPCERFTVVVRGTRLAIQYRDGEEDIVDVAPGVTGWDAPEPRVHRAVNLGDGEYEEVVMFFRPLSHQNPDQNPDQDPQPDA